jgi:hypothetical protein
MLGRIGSIVGIRRSMMGMVLGRVVRMCTGRMRMLVVMCCGCRLKIEEVIGHTDTGVYQSVLTMPLTSPSVHSCSGVRAPDMMGKMLLLLLLLLLLDPVDMMEGLRKEDKRNRNRNCVGG